VICLIHKLLYQTINRNNQFINSHSNWLKVDADNILELGFSPEILGAKGGADYAPMQLI
jgi:hypothetical protein